MRGDQSGSNVGIPSAKRRVEPVEDGSSPIACCMQVYQRKMLHKYGISMICEDTGAVEEVIGEKSIKIKKSSHG
jgi:hypothetical protein